MNEIQKYIAANEPKIMEDLFSLIRIPSISALPEHHDDLHVHNAGHNYCSKPEQTKHW